MLSWTTGHKTVALLLIKPPKAELGKGRRNEDLNTEVVRTSYVAERTQLLSFICSSPNSQNYKLCAECRIILLMERERENIKRPS